MNRAAEEEDMADAIALKKAEFGLCETEEATLWLSIAAAQQHGNDNEQLRKRHKETSKEVCIGGEDGEWHRQVLRQPH
jgi:hypothetical protein